MSITDTTTTSITPYAGWDIDVQSTGAQVNRKTIDLTCIAPVTNDDFGWVPDDCDDLFAESLALTKPTLWDKILLITEAFTKPVSEPGEVLDEVTMLRRVRHYLALNTTELAEVMNVERPTIYAWLEGTIRIRRSNRARIETILSLAETWWARSSGVPLGKQLHLRGPAGKSVFEMFKEPELRPGEIAALLELLAESAVSAPASTFGVQGVGLAKVPDSVRKASVRRAARRTRR